MLVSYPDNQSICGTQTIIYFLFEISSISFGFKLFKRDNDQIAFEYIEIKFTDFQIQAIRF